MCDERIGTETQSRWRHAKCELDFSVKRVVEGEGQGEGDGKVNFPFLYQPYNFEPGAGRSKFSGLELGLFVFHFLYSFSLLFFFRCVC